VINEPPHVCEPPYLIDTSQGHAPCGAFVPPIIFASTFGLTPHPDGLMLCERTETKRN
jgi:hypothetical protein